MGWFYCFFQKMLTFEFHWNTNLNEVQDATQNDFSHLLQFKLIGNAL